MNQNGVITIDGFSLSYRIEGEGIPVMVVGSAIFYPQLFSANIRKKLKLIFIDHRGFAKPPRLLQFEDFQINRVLDDIETIRTSLNLEEMVILGHSGHAFMALEYAKKFPQHVQKVVLLNSAPTNSRQRQEQSFSYFHETADQDRKRKFAEEMALLPLDLEKEPDRRFAHMCIRLGAQSFYDYHFDGAYMWEGVYTNMQVIDHLWGEAFAEQNMIQGLVNFEKPVFIGLGKYDFLVGPFSLWEKIENLHLMKKVIFEKSGHYPMFEEPDSFDSTLIHWLEEGK